MNTSLPNVYDQLPGLNLGKFQILDAPTHPKTQALFDYWSSMRNGKALPRKTDINPLRIPKLLPNLGLIEVDRSQGVRFRIKLYGTNAVEVAREERTGKFLEDIAQNLSAETRATIIDRWQQACLRAYETRLPHFTVGRRKDPERSFHIVHTAVLPLSADGNQVDHILGLIVTENDIEGE